MARKAKKEETTIKEQLTEVPEETENVVKKEEEVKDILDYLNEPNIRLGVDYRKKIKFRLDGHTLSGVIRPLSSDEVSRANTTNNMGQGALDKLIVSIGFYGGDGTKKIPMTKLDKFPAGVTSYIASEIMTLSGYNLNDEATQYLKKL